MTIKIIRRIDPTEHQIQCAIVEWANNTNISSSPFNIGDFLIAIPNGGNRSITEAIRLKKEGVKKGVSDMFLAVCGYNCISGRMVQDAGLWIEIKTKIGKLSQEQINWQACMKSNGYKASVVRSVDEGIQVIKDYLGMT